MNERMLQAAAVKSDRLAEESRRVLVNAVRAAARQGMSQRQIAHAVGRSQPEVSRLIRFHGDKPLAMNLRKHRDEVIAVVRRYGLENVRVFGSVARGDETADSDIDLVADPSRVISLMDYAAIENKLADLLGVRVDLVPSTELFPNMRQRILGEAIAL